MQKLTVDLGERSYPIYIGSGLLDQVQLYRPHIKGKRVAIVTNTTVAKLYLEQLAGALAEYQPTCIVLPDGEQHKDWPTLQKIFDALLQDRHDRSTTLIALGGGVIGDMTGFAAACYQRGVNFIQVPTTLLSQVDSSVGGKTGINHALGKNMIGAFYQPQAVIIDLATLSSLPPREFSAGMAEVIKYGLIHDAGFFDWLETNIEQLMQQQVELLAHAIERSCAIKAQVVALDERESGIRAILNLGHTFGHAIETEQGYGNWLHGEAVAAGTLMAVYMSARMGWLAEPEVQRTAKLLRKASLPVIPPAQMGVDTYLQHMQVDKKAQDGQIRLVLLERLGAALVTADYPAQLLREVLQADYQEVAGSQ